MPRSDSACSRSTPSCSSFLGPRWPSTFLGNPIDRLVEAAEELLALVRDPHFDDAAILAAADTRHQAAPLQAVHQPCDIGIARDHPVRDFAARQRGGMTAAQDPQHVVLVGRQFGRGLQKLFPWLHDAGGHHLQGQHHLLFAGGEAPRLFQFASEDASHDAVVKIVV